ncbi:hypothetical protein [Haloarcula hispanica pleomorphic virus 4]|uniref:Uncharacterized protein n=1 Tax=Haloarcula hispanica pleomorphic virus 4 TaxID=1980140 RepID=A0A2P0QEJ4_9VIRU|nr:hypothetical protein HOS97_gp02 [Haloarcula hispanica pleomorphic virus 4]ARM71116.1 hypothetical protein [Haloarcula hispanica pleomorphic virus 4]
MKIVTHAFSPPRTDRPSSKLRAAQPEQIGLRVRASIPSASARQVAQLPSSELFDCDASVFVRGCSPVMVDSLMAYRARSHLFGRCTRPPVRHEPRRVIFDRIGCFAYVPTTYCCINATLFQ